MRWVLVVLAVVFATWGSYHFFRQGPPKPPSAPVRDFELKAARGGTIRLSALKGKPVLLSFLHASSGPSRSQINVLRSMHGQYASKGLVVLLVDARYVETGADAATDDLINATYDWRLDAIPLLADGKAAGAAGKFGVKRLPTTLLLDGDGNVDQKWEGLAVASQLAAALNVALGPSAPGETKALAKFPGLPAARPLSDRLWVADGGAAWTSGTPFPSRWVAMGVDGDVRLEVKAEHIGTGAITMLEMAMGSIPEEEAKTLLSGFPGAPPKAHLADAAVTLPKPGLYRLTASVLISGDPRPAITGEAVVPAK